MILKIKILLLLLFFACISCGDSTHDSNRKINNLINRSNQEIGNLDYLKAIKYMKEAESLALKTNKDKLPLIYLGFSDALAGLEFQKESLSYLNKVMQMDFDKQSIFFKARVYQLIAYNYEELDLNKQ